MVVALILLHYNVYKNKLKAFENNTREQDQWSKTPKDNYVRKANEGRFQQDKVGFLISWWICPT